MLDYFAASATAARYLQEGDTTQHGDYTLKYDTIYTGGSKPQHIIEAHAPEGHRVGFMAWMGSAPHAINRIEVNNEHQRKGLATAMWNWAQESARPKPTHSRQRTDMGEAWAQSVGGRLPRRQARHENGSLGGDHEVPGVLQRAAGRSKPRRSPGAQPSGAAPEGAEADPAQGVQQGGADQGGAGLEGPRSVEFHPRAAKDLAKLDGPMRKRAKKTIDALANGEPGVQTHALYQSLAGWSSTKINHDHRIVHRNTDDGGIHIIYVGLHGYDEAARRTGVLERKPGPVTFSYLRNTEKAPNLGARYGQDIEPHGRYMTYHEGEKPSDGRWETGEVSFENPLHLDYGGNSGSDDHWKNRLSAQYGGKKGKSLSRALLRDGYDGIITHDEYGPSEIVDLSPLRRQASTPRKDEIEDPLRPGWPKHQRAISVAQEHARLEHPGITRPIDEGSGQDFLRHVLRQGGHPGADEAFVHIHNGTRRSSNTAVSSSTGAVGVSLHPSRADYSTLAHEAAHLLYDHQTGRNFGEPREDHEVHGIGFANHYARVLDENFGQKTPGGNWKGGPGQTFLNKYYETLAPIGKTSAKTDVCPCGLSVVLDPTDGWQHADGSVDHDGEHYGKSVSELMQNKRRKEAAKQDVMYVGGYLGDIGREQEYGDFRRVLYTSPKCQLTAMTLAPGEDIGKEVHNDVDQILILIEGEGECLLGGNIQPFVGEAVLCVPQGTEHNITNTGKKPMRLATVYAPAHHAPGTVHHTKADAKADRGEEFKPVKEAKRRPKLKSRIFGPTFGLDPRLFDGDQLKPEVRTAVMARLGPVIEPLLGQDWMRYTKVYLAGSEASEWTSRTREGNGDFDTLIGIDYDHLKGEPGIPAAGLDDDQINAALNVALRANYNASPWEAPFGGSWDLTGYVNANSYDIRKIKPYAAYNISDDEWAVKPPHLPDWDFSKHPAYKALLAEMRGYADAIEAIDAMPEPFRTQQGTALWNHLHSDRARAFSDEGEGWSDPGNMIEKALVEWGAWDKLADIKFGRTKTASAGPMGDFAEYCETCKTEHPYQFDEEDHYRSHTDWDTENVPGTSIKNPHGSAYSRIPREIHRGMVVNLPDDVHAKVHGQGAEEDKAHALMEHLGQRPLGMHWTASSPEMAAEVASDEADQMNPRQRSGATHVVLHADKPKREHIETDIKRLVNGSVISFHGGSAEAEVPMKEGAPMNLWGVSWKHHQEPGWHFHEFDQPITKKASGMPVEQVRLDKIWPHREWEHQPGGYSYDREGGGPYGWKHDAESWARNKQSVADEGIKEPITLEYNPKTHAAYVGEGNHRLHWARELGHETVPVRVWRTSKEMHPRYNLPGDAPEHEGHIPQELHPRDVLPEDWFPTQQKQAGARGDLPEGLTFEHRTHRGPYGLEHMLIARHPDAGDRSFDNHVGHLSWFDDDGEIAGVEVEPEWKRRGVATELHRRAKEITPHLQHADEEHRSDQGKAWIKSLSVKGSEHPLAPDLPQEQHNALTAEPMSVHKRKLLELAKNPVPGVHMWRGEVRKGDPIQGARETGVGIHWGLNPDTIVRPPAYGDDEHEVVYHAELEHPGEQNFERSHPMWGGSHRSLDSEAEVRLKPGGKVKLHGVWVRNPHHSDPGYFVPRVPERMGGQWTYHPIGEHVPVAHRPTSDVIDYTDVGVRHEGVLDYFIASNEDDTSYRMQHRPPGPDGIPIHDLTNQGGDYSMPEDYYTHPHYYSDMSEPSNQVAHNVIRRVRGKPEANVRIYRALPAEHAHQGFRPGDWVSTSKEYARQHGMQEDSKNDWPVISAVVKAKHLHTDADDLREFGYNGPESVHHSVSFKGGHNQEVREHTDGVIRPVQRQKQDKTADRWGSHVLKLSPEDYAKATSIRNVHSGEAAKVVLNNLPEHITWHPHNEDPQDARLQAELKTEKMLSAHHPEGAEEPGTAPLLGVTVNTKRGKTINHVSIKPHVKYEDLPSGFWNEHKPLKTRATPHPSLKAEGSLGDYFGVAA